MKESGELMSEYPEIKFYKNRIDELWLKSGHPDPENLPPPRSFSLDLTPRLAPSPPSPKIDPKS